MPATSLEQELWKSHQSGDDHALSAIYSMYFDPLFNYGFRFTRDTTLIEDCIQELFLKLIRNRRNLSLPASVKAYLFKSFRSHIIDKMEQARRRPVAEINEYADFSLELNHEDFMISTEESDSRKQRLKAALDQLTPRQREAIFLKYEEGLSYPEIAEMLALTQKATYKLIGRAVQTLRTIYQLSLSSVLLKWAICFLAAI